MLAVYKLTVFQKAKALRGLFMGAFPRAIKLEAHRIGFYRLKCGEEKLVVMRLWILEPLSQSNSTSLRTEPLFAAIPLEEMDWHISPSGKIYT